MVCRLLDLLARLVLVLYTVVPIGPEYPLSLVLLMLRECLDQAQVLPRLVVLRLDWSGAASGPSQPFDLTHQHKLEFLGSSSTNIELHWPGSN